MDTGLSGLGVIVTGGAGGIGAAVVRAFAAEGAGVAVHHHTSGDAATALAAEVGGVAVGGDLSDISEAERVVVAAAAELGRLDVCVANAGRWPQEDVPLWDIDPARWAATLADNLTSVYATARAYLRHAAAAGGGSLVLVGSTAGIFGEAGHADYAAAKAAVMYGILPSLKNEVARLDVPVRVNAVAPGWILTPRRLAAGIDPAAVDRATATMALKKLGTPEDVAAAVVVLASDRLSGHVTGHVAVVAGGMEGRLVP